MMKLIIFAIILVVQCVRGDHESIEWECTREKNSLLESSIECYSSLPTIDDLLTEINRTLGDSGGDPNLIAWFSQKICSIGHRALSCFAIESDYREPCLTLYHFQVASHGVQNNASQAVLNYICTNNGQIFIDFVQDDGVEVFADLLNCVPNTNDSDLFHEPNYPRFRINPAYCESLQEMFVCYANLVNNRRNSNLRRIGRELYDILMNELYC